MALWDEAGASKTAAPGSSLAQRFRSLFSANERDEYESGDAIDVLDHMRVPEEQGRYFKNALRSGGVLLTLNAGTRSAEALAILRRSNAVTSENIGLQHFTRMAQQPETGLQRVELLGETLRIHKERIPKGAV